MATIKDVAKMAGVSTTTVSHVINNTRHVAEDTKNDVLQAIQTLNYSPSAVARSLKVNTTHSVGMIVTTSEAPYFAEIIQAVEDHCYRQGYSLFLCNTQNNPEKLKNHLDMLAKKRVDGILVMCSEYTPDSLDLLKNFSELPMVVMDWGPNNPNTDLIQDNSFDGGYLATQHLIDNGHKKIGIIAGELTKTTAKTRYEGFVKALLDAGLVVNPDWIMEGSFEPDSLDLLKNFSELPMVVMDWGPNNPNTDLIQDNSFDGGYLATQHLIDNGHKKIGIIAGELTKTTAKTRYEGFVKALLDAGLVVNPDWIMEGSFEPEDGYECMNKILRQNELPTAVFCCNDVMALGAISAITEKGLRVPDDISIIGYDNIHSSRFYAPPLTTVHQSKSRLGERALKLLFERIHEKSAVREVIEMHPELVIRQSVKRLD